jgi:hypothetical protein
MTHQIWRIHSGIGRMELEKKRVRSLNPLNALDRPRKLPPGSKMSLSPASKTLFTLKRERCSKTNVLRRLIANDQTPALKSSLLVKSNNLGGYCSGPAKRIFGPLLRTNTIQSPNSTFGSVTCDTPPLREGGARSKRDRFKRTPTSLCTFCTFPQ